MAVGDLDVARAVLLPYWREVCETFKAKGFLQPSLVKFEVVEWAHDTCRHFAAAEDDGSAVYVAPDLAHMPDHTALAILAHEAGHAVDLSEPGRWWARGGELLRVDPLPTKGWKRHLETWQSRSDDEVEAVADYLAEHVMERTIGYVGSPGCLVQSFDGGVPRPKGLR